MKTYQRRIKKINNYYIKLLFFEGKINFSNFDIINLNFKFINSSFSNCIILFLFLFLFFIFLFSSVLILVYNF